MQHLVLLDEVNVRFCLSSLLCEVCWRDSQLCVGNMLRRWRGSYLWSNWRHESQHLELAAWDSDSRCLQLSVLEHVKVRL